MQCNQTEAAAAYRFVSLTVSHLSITFPRRPLSQILLSVTSSLLHPPPTHAPDIFHDPIPPQSIYRLRRRDRCKTSPLALHTKKAVLTDGEGRREIFTELEL